MLEHRSIIEFHGGGSGSGEVNPPVFVFSIETNFVRFAFEIGHGSASSSSSAIAPILGASVEGATLARRSNYEYRYRGHGTVQEGGMRGFMRNITRGSPGALLATINSDSRTRSRRSMCVCVPLTPMLHMIQDARKVNVAAASCFIVPRGQRV